MISAEDSPEELTAWLEQAWRQLRPSHRGGFGRPAVDDFVADVLERLRSGERLDPYEIRMAPQFPITAQAQFPAIPGTPFRSERSAAYDPLDVLTLRQELADRVLRSLSVSTEALAGHARVPPAAVAMAELIKVARFRTRPTAGYDQREVDEYLIGVERSLRRGDRLNGPAVRARDFRRKLGQSYSAKDVRQLLERVARYADTAAGG
jgi:hypothetical protein